jgi:hypothetical protein
MQGLVSRLGTPEAVRVAGVFLMVSLAISAAVSACSNVTKIVPVADGFYRMNALTGRVEVCRSAGCFEAQQFSISTQSLRSSGDKRRFDFGTDSQ